MLETETRTYNVKEIIGFDKEVEYLKHLSILIDKHLEYFNQGIYDDKIYEEIRYLLHILHTNLGEPRKAQRKIVNSMNNRAKLIARIKEINYEV